MSDDEPSIMKLGESRVGFGPYRMPAIIAIKRDGGVILNDSCKQPLSTGELVTKIFTEDYTISVGPDYQVYIFANNEHEAQDMMKKLEEQQKSEEKKKPNNILRNLFWLGIVAAILAAFML